ncbi:MAG: neutral/alkaline non-lysosomal ceramidase N-terminal domain-containing protein [Bryobacterales bacterium]|nr:neutral/alkaline non-lysosomal ceramidase N-terminal domain-containing protein [Bryobacterales bacterium]
MIQSLLLLIVMAAAAHAEWKVGAAKVKITPDEPIWLAGYGNRNRPHEGVLQDIFIKAAAFRDESGSTAVITTSDLVGLDKPTLEIVSRRVREKYGIPRERLLFNYSHNHSCPVTGEVLKLYYPLNEQQRGAVERYTRKLYDWYVDVIGKAVEALAPATVEFEQGLAGIAVNRRRSRPGGRKLPGPVDQDVPVLTARSEGKVRAILFGYSCHATALSGYQVNGDYPGYAQEELEKRYPDAIALFVMGCGGDANPLPRKMGVTDDEAVDLARMYGKILATAARQVVEGKMSPVAGPLRVAYGEARVPFQKAPTREQLVERGRTMTGPAKRYNEFLIKELDTNGKLMDHYPYPVQVFEFGDSLRMIGLTGENVVDYCLRFKQQYGWERTWVAGYNNELLSYIPSLRVLKEGGYEGTEGIPEYGLPAPYGWGVEEVIAERVEDLVRSLKP